MAAEKGNQYYKLRINERGTKLSHIELAALANEYFEHCIDNPIISKEPFNTKLGIEVKDIEKIRAFTIKGFCIFAGISSKTFFNYEDSEDKDMLHTLTRIRDIIETQKYQNAAAGTLNPMFIGKDILTDKRDIKSDGKALQKNVISFNGKEFEI